MIQARPRPRAGRVRRALVVYACGATPADRSVRDLVESLHARGIQTVDLEAEDGARQIAGEAIAVNADSVELCLGGRGGAVPLLRTLLRELIRLNRRDVCIVIHRVGRYYL